MLKLEEGWLTVVLLCAMLMVAGGGVAAAGWTEGLHAAWISGVTGVLAGLALAKSRFSGPTVAIFATLYGVFAVGFFIGLNLEGDWHQRSLEIVTRLNAFLYKALYGGTSRDALPFPVAISLIFWYVGVLSAWSVFRRGAIWPAVIPGGVGLLINAYYYLGPARLDLYLAVYMLIALMFVARMNLLDREREWQSAKVLYSTDLRLDFLRAGMAAALAGVLIAWAAPGLAASPQAATTWRRVSGSLGFVRESWLRMFAAIRGYGQAHSDFYGDSLTLGGPARLSTEPIMDVTVLSLAGQGEEQTDDVLGNIERYYWKANTLGTYRDGAWYPSESEFKEFDPSRTRLAQPAYLQRRQANLAFTMHVPASSRLYVSQQMEWLDRPATLELAFHPAGSFDVANARARDVVRRGEIYQVIASISVADATSLRAAGTDYPQWVIDHYMTLPPEITDRTRALAEQIVQEAGATNPFDQAEAITSWLRRNIAYDQTIDAPPPDVEPLDYFLFELRRGYCNYYASAEVVLLRSLGIPARLAVGMGQGRFDPRTNTYHVLEQNAHAWPEVYFPRYGWVEFEPTVSEDPLVRPEQTVPVESNAGDTTNPEDDLESGRDDSGAQIPEDDLAGDTPGTQLNAFERLLARVPWATLLLSLLVVLAAGLAGVVVAFRAGMLGWESLGRLGKWVLTTRGQALPSAVGVIYLQLERVANWLGLGTGTTTTPYERAAALGGFLPEVRPGVDAITEEYVAEKYSPRPADLGVARQAWRGIRFKLWHDALREFLLSVLEETPPEPAAPRPRR